jgi:hypothetical protein
MSETVARTLIDVLERIGLKQIFGLIGHSLNPIADAVRHIRALIGPVRQFAERQVSFVPIRPSLGQRTGQQGRIGWQGRGT